MRGNCPLARGEAKKQYNETVITVACLLETAAHRRGTIRDGPLEEHLARVHCTATPTGVRQGEKTCLNGFSS